MAPVLRVDDEVWEWLKSQATPLEDTPNSVLRKVAGLEQTPAPPPARGPKRREARGHVPGGGRSRLLRPFLQRLEMTVAKKGGSVSIWDGGSGRRTSNIVVVAPSRRRARFLLYIKTRSESDGFWGLRENQLDSLQASGLHWKVVLLIGPQEKGYVLPPDLVERAIAEHRWSFGQAGDFKVHENHEIAASSAFNDWKSLVVSLLE